MSEPDSKKSRRPLKPVPPDRFQPKMLIFWLVLVAAVLALLYGTTGMSPQPEMLTIQEVVERAEAGHVSTEARKGAVIRPDPGGGSRDWHTVTGESRMDASGLMNPSASIRRWSQPRRFACRHRWNQHRRATPSTPRLHS